MTHQARTDRIIEQFEAQGEQSVVLHKSTSNLFRDRQELNRQRLDLRSLNQVLSVNSQEGWIEAEGLTTFDELTRVALTHEVLPAVVPQLKSITVGGAVAGVGIESSSFRHGLVHDAVLEMDVLSGDGHILTCTRANDFRDLFYGFANSYGSLGYITRLKMKTVPAKPFVSIRHRRYDNGAAYFHALRQVCEDSEASGIDFVDGVVFSGTEMYITTGKLVPDAPFQSDYSFENIFYESIRQRETDYLSVSDYIWRWDTDWFWCSKNLYLNNPWLRRLVGRKRLNSTNYARVMRWNSRLGLTRRLERLRGIHSESVIQDVDIPVERAAEFLQFFQREIGITPVWICPIRAADPDEPFPLYPIQTKSLSVNFGFWDVVRSKQTMPPGQLNRKIEHKVCQLDGIKSLYSDAFFSSEEFADCYGGEAYRQLKRRYDPAGRFPGMFEKCVQGH